jgi:hypothetical protein
MKKSITIFSFIILSTFGFSQQTSKGIVSRVFTKEKLSEIKSINELVPDSLKNNTFVMIDIVGTVHGKLTQINGKVDEIMEEVKNILRKADVGTKIYIDTKYIDPKADGKKYKPLAFSIKVTIKE